MAAALIRRGASILICRRKEDQAHPLKWEFPGGKVEAGETPVQALGRELAEELAIDARIGGEVQRYEYSYPGKAPILLIFYTVDGFRGEPRNRIFHEIRWVAPETLPEFDFLEGDVELVRRLAAAG